MKSTLYIAFIAASISFLSCKKEEKKPANEITDARDGQKYKFVQIGTQTWLTSAAKFKTANSTTCPNNECDVYGVFYTFTDAKSSACPAGYHVASDREWQTLEFNLGMLASDTGLTGARGNAEGIGTKLKDGGSSGLNLKLTGLFSGTNFGVNGQYWTSSQNPTDNTQMYTRFIRASDAIVSRTSYVNPTNTGRFCARCIKD
jgi:uncharacterized protein (TIGR02145 family)